jgi:hypothetical protein
MKANALHVFSDIRVPRTAARKSASAGSSDLDELTSLATAYQVSQALHVAVKLGIPDLLRNRARSVESLANRAGADEDSLYRLLRVLASFDVFVETSPRKFTLGSLGRQLRGDSGSGLHALVAMYGSNTFWETWGRLFDCVKTGRPAVEILHSCANVFEYYASQPAIAATVSAGMTARSSLFAETVIPNYDFSRFGTMVDVGGGRGFLLATLLAKNPRLRGTLFDTPQIIAAAQPPQAKRAAARWSAVAGDFFQHVPEGADVYVLSRVLHDWNGEQARRILDVCGAAMQPDSTLLILERVLPVTPGRTVKDRRCLLSDLNMLVRTGGRERTRAEYGRLLKSAGMKLLRLIPTQSEISIIEAAPHRRVR